MSENKDIGGLWAKTSKDGKEFMSGTITIGETAYEIVLFRNSYKKEGDKTPDWRIYPSKPRAEAVEETMDMGRDDADGLGEDAIPF